jgi:hypothetical protein
MGDVALAGRGWIVMASTADRVDSGSNVVNLGVALEDGPAAGVEGGGEGSRYHALAFAFANSSVSFRGYVLWIARADIRDDRRAAVALLLDDDVSLLRQDRHNDILKCIEW